MRLHDGETPPADPAAPPALWLALATLDSARREDLLDELEAALASVEARVNPLLIDLIEEDPGVVLRRNAPWLLPLCSAAHSLLIGRFGAPDGFSVEVLASDAPARESDLSAWGPVPTDARARRARFLAWPASRSVLVRARTREVREAIDVDLRRAGVEASSAIALVLNRLVCCGQSGDARLDRVLSLLSHASESRPSDDLPAVGLRVPEPPAPLLPWVSLSDAELLVVPKLGGLSPSSRFASEVLARIRGYRAEMIGVAA